MSLFDIAGDAQRAFTVLQHGGAAIVPHSIGYAALGGSAATLRRIFEAKRRGPAKRNAMVANLAIQSEVQQCTPRGRDIVRAIVEDYDLPLGCIAPCRLDHPMLAALDAETLAASTRKGTVAMLLNAGHFHAELTRLSHDALFPLFGSSANLSLSGTKFRVEDIEPQIIAIADIVIDHGQQRWSLRRVRRRSMSRRSKGPLRSSMPISPTLKRHFSVELPWAAGQSTPVLLSDHKLLWCFIGQTSDTEESRRSCRRPRRFARSANRQRTPSPRNRLPAVSRA
jgi:tRNA A37 threonylcarbamoyladenosine synthetase subunit TsaC/SUA5/YrdC